MRQFSFDVRLIYAILNGRVSTAVNRKLVKTFKENNIDITPEQWTVLLYLWDKDGVPQQEICDATFLDKPCMTRLLDSMERMNYVVRIPSKTDRRTNIIHLTRRGKEMEDIAKSVANKTLMQALRGLTIEEIRISQEVLRKVFNNAKG